MNLDIFLGKKTNRISRMIRDKYGRNDSQIFLSARDITPKEFKNIGNKEHNAEAWKTHINEHRKNPKVAAFTMAEQLPKKIFIGSAMKNWDFSKPAPIHQLSKTLGHEEIHQTLQEHGTPDWTGATDANDRFDNINIPSVVHKGILLNPHSASEISPRHAKEYNEAPVEKRTELLSKYERIYSDESPARRIMGWHGNIEKQSIHNPNYRNVLQTGKHAQLVLMSLKPKEEIGNEKHPRVDQFFRIESGKAKFVLNNGRINYIEAGGGAVMIPAGTWHNIINPSPNKALKLYTIYSPPNHPPGTIQKDKPSKDMAKFYHGTHKAAVPGIMREGIKPSSQIRIPGLKDPSMSPHTNPELTYFFEKPAEAQTWARVVSEHTGFPPAIIEADIPKRTVKPDWNMEMGMAVSHKGRVPPEKLKEYEEDER